MIDVDNISRNNDNIGPCMKAQRLLHLAIAAGNAEAEKAVSCSFRCLLLLFGSVAY